MPEVIFSGPDGRLEGRYRQGATPNAPLALVLHPHPQFGGTMNNKVVFHLAEVFLARGFTTLRLNFRGVGRSQGVFDNGIGELSDAAAALDWLQAQNPNAVTSWVVGFSFGAWIGMQLLMRRPEVGGFIAVAAPANTYDFSFLAPCPSSGLLVHGTADDVVPMEDVDKFAERLKSQKAITVDYAKIQDATHFFDEHLDELMAIVGEYLDRVLLPV